MLMNENVPDRQYPKSNKNILFSKLFNRQNEKKVFEVDEWEWNEKTKNEKRN